MMILVADTQNLDKKGSPKAPIFKDYQTVLVLQEMKHKNRPRASIRPMLGRTLPKIPSHQIQ